MENPQESTHEVKIAPPPSTTLSPSMEENKAAAPPSPPPNTLLPIIALALRAVALGSLVGLLVNLPAAVSIPAENGQKEIKYSHFLVYRYMVTCAGIGIVFTILLIDISFSQVITGNLPSKFALINEIMLILLSAGGAASVGLTMELSRLPREILNRIVTSEFLNSINALNCIYLLGFIFNFVASILTRVAASSYTRSME